MKGQITLQLDLSQLDLLREMHEIAAATLLTAPLMVKMLGVSPGMDYNKTGKEFSALMQDIVLQAKAHNQLNVKLPENGDQKKLIARALDIAIKHYSNEGHYTKSEQFLNLKHQLYDNPVEQNPSKARTA